MRQARSLWLEAPNEAKAKSYKTHVAGEAHAQSRLPPPCGQMRFAPDLTEARFQSVADVALDRRCLVNACSVGVQVAFGLGGQLKFFEQQGAVLQANAAADDA